MRSIQRFFSDQRAASAAEFALVLPLLILFLLGIVDVGRLMYTYNEAEKATQMGVRYAVVTDFVAANLNTDFTDSPNNLVGGDPVPPTTFSTTTCDSANCTGGWGYDDKAFDAIVARMNRFYPAITDANVTIRYDNVGLGFAGDPSGPDVAALVTVRLQSIQFRPWSFMGIPVNLPAFSAALTMEDGDVCPDVWDSATCDAHRPGASN